MISSDRPKSVESLATIASVSSPTKHTSSQYDPSGRFPHRPRYDSRRSSTASSINGGVGGALDSSLHHGSITEAGHNGLLFLLLGLVCKVASKAMLIFYLNFFI